MAQELQTTLDLLLSIVHELMSFPSSHASTPATPLSATHRKLPGKSPVSTPSGTGSDIVTTEQLVLEMICAYLSFFDVFLKETVLEGKDKGTVFSTACQLLVLMATFGTSKEHTCTSTNSQGKNMCESTCVHTGFHPVEGGGASSPNHGALFQI